MEDPQTALLACSLIATEVLNHLKPTVSLAEDVKAGEDNPLQREPPCESFWMKVSLHVIYWSKLYVYQKYERTKLAN